MRKKMLTAFLWWSFVLVATAITTFVTDNIWAFMVTAVWMVFPFLTWLVNFYVAKKLQIKIQVKPTAIKKKESYITLILNNTSALSVGKVLGKLEFYNHLTGEKQYCIVELPLKAKGSSKEMIQMCSEHCGYIRINLKETILTDAFGFLPIRCLLTAQRKVAILPDIFQTQIYLQLQNTVAEDAPSWSKEQTGDDYAELFSLRDYKEGDGMKQIHWKLSSKKNMLITKEASLPATRSLLLFWDKNTKEVTAEEMDAMAEVVASVSQAIMEMGVVFTLGWTEGQECRYEEIESEDLLIQVLPQMLKYGTGIWNGNFWKENLEQKGRYGKIIYFANVLPEYMEELQGENIEFILCKEEAEGAYTFTPETYMQDMEIIKL